MMRPLYIHGWKVTMAAPLPAKVRSVFRGERVVSVPFPSLRFVTIADMTTVGLTSRYYVWRRANRLVVRRQEGGRPTLVKITTRASSRLYVAPLIPHVGKYGWVCFGEDSHHRLFANETTVAEEFFLTGFNYGSRFDPMQTNGLTFTLRNFFDCLGAERNGWKYIRR